jgi:hypothetical protein
MTHYCIVSLLFFMLTTRGIFQSNFCNEKFLDKTPSQPIAGYSGTSLSSQLQRRLRSGGSWFQASPGKKKFYKITSQRKKAGRGGTGLSSQRQQGMENRILVQTTLGKN